jgi:predicted TIM-barrel fold metal-dependent hydrolase
MNPMNDAKLDIRSDPNGITPISADSHITEPPNCYIDNIELRYRNIAPRIESEDIADNRGDVYVIDGITQRIALGLIAAAGKDPAKLKTGDASFAQLHRGGWDPVARIADQDRDGVGGEVIYPSIGMVLCSHPDADYKSACMWAYNRWLQEFVGAAPDRLFGIGMTAVRSVSEAVEDLRRIKEMGFKGAMLPGYPATEHDYDHESFDPLWEAAIDLEIPLSFHILTMDKPDKNLQMAKINRGPKINGWHSIIRGCQDIIGMFIFGGVFERNPGLRIVSVEADAGWAPHFMYRMDHAYKRHRSWMKCEQMSKLPSEFFMENIYLTFQDDWTVFRMTGMCNARRLLWANDFPHSDSTWPNSQAMLADQVKWLSTSEKRWILRDNVAELYRLAPECLTAPLVART